MRAPSLSGTRYGQDTTTKAKNVEIADMVATIRSVFPIELRDIVDSQISNLIILRITRMPISIQMADATRTSLPACVVASTET